MEGLAGAPELQYSGRCAKSDHRHNPEEVEPLMSRPEALATIQIDNERLRVTEWRFAPGTETGWHVHPSDYVVVPMTTGALVLETCEGSITNELTAGVSYTRPAGSEHNVFNDAQTEFVFVEIELK